MEDLSSNELDIFESIVHSLHLVDSGEGTRVSNKEELQLLALAALVCYCNFLL